MTHSFVRLSSPEDMREFINMDFFSEDDPSLSELKTYLSAFGEEWLGLSGLLECSRGTILGIRYRPERDWAERLPLSKAPKTGIQLYVRTPVLHLPRVVDISYGENVPVIQYALDVERFLVRQEMRNPATVL